jgi:hypothetical protein
MFVPHVQVVTLAAGTAPFVHSDVDEGQLDALYEREDAMIAAAARRRSALSRR